MSNREELLKKISKLEDEKIRKALKLTEQMQNDEEEYALAYEELEHNHWRVSYWKQALEGNEFTSTDPDGDIHTFKPINEQDVLTFYELAVKDYKTSERRMNLVVALKNIFDLLFNLLDKPFIKVSF